MPLHPIVSWAERAEFIYLTVNVSDITEPKIELTPTKFVFKGKGEKEQNEYECEIEFNKTVNVEKSKQHLTARNLTMIIYKAEDSQGYWNKLQKGGKLNFLKVDFAKWRDEDEEDDQPDPMNNMGDLMSGQGMGGMDFSQFLNNPDLQNMAGGDEGDSDDDELEGDEEQQAPASTEEKK
ncbi:HSP20-like chaperone [Cunninghamella echinulata]|nr:HSP20-like chaperone [Cunninghamella echinulata]